MSLIAMDVVLTKVGGFRKPIFSFSCLSTFFAEEADPAAARFAMLHRVKRGSLEQESTRDSGPRDCRNTGETTLTGPKPS